MKVILIIATLEAGGAERTITQMGNYWVKKHWEVSIVTLTGSNSKPHYFLDARINHVPLDIIQNSTTIFQAIKNNIRRIRVLKKALKSIPSDIIISFGDKTNILALIALFGSKKRIIISERSNPLLQPIGRGWNIARECLYRTSEQVVIQTKQAASCYSSQVRKNITIIPNPIDLPDEFNEKLIEEKPDRLRKNTIAAMGRFTSEKGFDFLIQAFSIVAPKYPDWVLKLWGKGPLQSDLSKQVQSLNLEERILFCGQTRQPFKALQSSDMFVLSSRWEGFPNVLLEAMSCGLPVVSFDCPFGPSQIIRTGINGILVPCGDVQGLAKAMDCLMGDDNLRSDLALKAQEVVEQYSLPKIMKMWEGIISESATDGSAFA